MAVPGNFHSVLLQKGQCWSLKKLLKEQRERLDKAKHHYILPREKQDISRKDQASELQIHSDLGKVVEQGGDHAIEMPSNFSLNASTRWEKGDGTGLTEGPILPGIWGLPMCLTGGGETGDFWSVHRSFWLLKTILIDDFGGFYKDKGGILRMRTKAANKAVHWGMCMTVVLPEDEALQVFCAPVWLLCWIPAAAQKQWCFVLR